MLIGYFFGSFLFSWASSLILVFLLIFPLGWSFYSRAGCSCMSPAILDRKLHPASCIRVLHSEFGLGSCRRHKSRAARRTRNFWFVKSKAICCAAISTNIVCSTGSGNFCFLALVRYGCRHQKDPKRHRSWGRRRGRSSGRRSVEIFVLQVFLVAKVFNSLLALSLICCKAKFPFFPWKN